MEEISIEIPELVKDVLISLLILAIILSSLYVYTGRWPPMVVVESGSMSHFEGESRIGVIDAGDIVLVRHREKVEIVSYVEGKAIGHERYGQYGDVIIFRPDGDKQRTPIIHRPVVWLEFNETTGDSFDVPSLRYLEHSVEWNTTQGERYFDLNGTVYIYDYGHRGVTLEINLDSLINRGSRSGYITMGDNNIRRDRGRYDQAARIADHPIREEWIVGKARGELPWYGIIKLLYLGNIDDIPTNSWYYFFSSIFLIVLIPFIIEIILDRYKKDDERKKREDKKFQKDKNLPVLKKKSSKGDQPFK